MTILPSDYRPTLGLYETQRAIGAIKSIFQIKLCAALHLKRVTAPLFVDPATGLNDDLNGVERPVSFDIPAVGKPAQVVHALAKWKRLALHEYNFYVGNGLITDMNAIHRDETLGCALEISSMGIRVDAASLDRQLTEAGCDSRRDFPFHQMLLRGELPLTIGGGIGQSRLCMLLLQKAHIGEVQASLWDSETRRSCKTAGIVLL